MKIKQVIGALQKQSEEGLINPASGKTVGTASGRIRHMIGFKACEAAYRFLQYSHLFIKEEDLRWIEAVGFPVLWQCLFREPYYHSMAARALIGLRDLN